METPPPRTEREVSGLHQDQEQRVRKPFVAACDLFVYSENLRTPVSVTTEIASTGPDSWSRERLRADTTVVNQLRQAVEGASGEDGWARLAKVGQLIARQRSDFDARTYGYPKLGLLIAAIDLFDMERRESGEGKVAVTWVRDKRRRS
ncbi:OST-HTH/LOTUS domain-containing protein [Winogradskya humida]|uniref:HTH OST-type domain-containing protein n=1 Tax=Winogradskya humida TaxID=113566 RepID=A0ABQ4A7T6_9ACTN|nr:OST-HTH/LOTUS domain-containing protein [Actinoplanes humidus]GIE26935.1 hypothetical protein Ahu01nite_100370 [Actinoplanes humidus]